MHSNEKTYLTLEEVHNILPDFLKFDLSERKERSVYKTIKGKPLPIINSKKYPENYYWYSCITKYFKDLGSEYICFTAGNFGVLVIPIDVVLHYNKFSGWKGESKKGLQYHVRIKHNAENKMTVRNFKNPFITYKFSDFLNKLTIILITRY